MRYASRSPRRRSAFTLVELLVAMTVLVLLALMVGQLISSATSVTTSNRKHLDTDGQARLVFDRMAADFSRMLRRTDVDFIFSRPSGSSQGVNDRMFFYSEAPAFYDGNSSTTAALQQRSSLSLLGYRINAAFQLERLGKLLTWDGLPVSGGGTSMTSPGGIMFLSCPSMTVNPDPLSTLTGNWPTAIGTVSDSPPYNGQDDDYHVLSGQVFRLEFCYLLKPVLLNDGSYQAAAYSGIPVTNPVDTTNPRKNNLTASQAPQAGSDSSMGYVVGSRWFNMTDGRAYICVNNTVGAARWNPLGVQDVAGIVVGIAVLDSTSTNIVPKTSVTVNNVSVSAPNLASAVGAFADVPITNVTASSNTVPDLTITPPRLMAEAWNNAMLSSTFATTAGMPQTAASQVRIYQRCFPLNGD